MSEEEIKTSSAINVHRGIYLLPNLLTTASLFFGFYALVSAMQGFFSFASMAIFAAMIFDNLDGRVARLTNTQTAFGAEYDSLSDMVTFGIAPALLAYQWSLGSLGKVGWLIAFFYAATTGLRLARFNTQVGTADKKYFQGLPCPAAAGTLVSCIWFLHGNTIDGHYFGWGIAILTAFAGIFMVSNFRYYSFKEINFAGKVPFVWLLLVVVLFIVISTYPALVLFLAFFAYACSGPILTIIKRRKMRHLRHQPKTDLSKNEHTEKKDVSR